MVKWLVVPEGSDDLLSFEYENLTDAMAMYAALCLVPGITVVIRMAVNGVVL